MINQLVIGKSYESRGGEIFTIHGAGLKPFENYPYYDKVKKQSWTYRGVWALGKKSEYDLIREAEKVEEKQDLKLEVGKTYKNGGGEEVEITRYEEQFPKDKHPFFGSDDEWYAENGQFLLRSNNNFSDLVEEVKEKKVEEKQKLKLEVGKTYMAKDGEEVEIIKYIPQKTFPFLGDDHCDYTEDGRFRLDRESIYDLVEEIKTDKEIKMDKIITPEEYLRQFTEITDKMKEITKAKNSDYTADSGDAFANFKVVEDLGVCSVETGFLTRMSDKIARLAGLAKGKEIAVKDEKYEDTLLDLANYSILLAVYLQNKR